MLEAKNDLYAYPCEVFLPFTKRNESKKANKYLHISDRRGFWWMMEMEQHQAKQYLPAEKGLRTVGFSVLFLLMLLRSNIHRKTFDLPKRIILPRACAVPGRARAALEMPSFSLYKLDFRCRCFFAPSPFVCDGDY